jgi:hypothetical protein
MFVPCIASCHGNPEGLLRGLEASNEFKEFAVGACRIHPQFLDRVTSLCHKAELCGLCRFGREGYLKSCWNSSQRLSRYSE